jgi:hypothetical protein
MLTPEGRRVKCSNCHEVWLQLPDSEELPALGVQGYDSIPEGVRPIPEGSNLPTVHPDETAGKYYARARAFGYASSVAVFAVIFAALLIFRPVIFEKAPFTKNFYTMLGYSTLAAGAHLTFSSLDVKAEPDAAGEKILITGKIINRSGNEEQIPLIEAQMTNQAGDILERWVIRPPESTVAGHGELSFSTNYLSATPGAAADIHLQFVAH